MKILLTMTIFLISLFTFAQDEGVYYTEGRSEGQMIESTGFLASYATCYKGNAWRVKASLVEMASGDIEMDNVKVWFNQQSSNIEFDFVSTKCMDDTLDATEESCFVEVEITKC